MVKVGDILICKNMFRGWVLMSRFIHQGTLDINIGDKGIVTDIEKKITNIYIPRYKKSKYMIVYFISVEINNKKVVFSTKKIENYYYLWDYFKSLKQERKKKLDRINESR